MYISVINDIEHLIYYIKEQEEKRWIGTLKNICNRYKKIISVLEHNKFYVDGLFYEDIDDSVKGNEMEFEAIILNLETLRNRLELYEANKTKTLVKPHFSEIKDKIIEQIKEANLCIWIVVAWFTDEDIYNELLKAKDRGINIQIIMINDKSTYLNFKHKIEVHYAPQYMRNRENIHNKFCVFDFRTVITGSFNWTKQAQKNSEDVVIIKNPEIGERYAMRFVELKCELHKNMETLT